MPPQVFRVIRCYKCGTFQVEQVKKSNKWKCKICGETQSLKKVYGEGSGFDCRQNVQRLNLLRKDIDEQTPASSDEGSSVKHGTDPAVYVDVDERQSPVISGGSSRWSRYLNDDRDMAAAECGDEECVSASVYRDEQTASTFDRLCRQEAASKRAHPYRRHERLHSVKPHNYKTQSNRPASAEPEYDGDVENKKSLVNKGDDCRRRQDQPIFHTASASNSDRSSKWSRFLSSDTMNDCNQLASDDEEEDESYATSILPSTTGAQPVNFTRNSDDNIPAASSIFASVDDDFYNLLGEN